MFSFLHVSSDLGAEIHHSLCAIHHQWLYGFTALKRCLGLMKIFEAPENRLPIEQELIVASVQGK